MNNEIATEIINSITKVNNLNAIDTPLVRQLLSGDGEEPSNNLKEVKKLLKVIKSVLMSHLSAGELF